MKEEVRKWYSDGATQRYRYNEAGLSNIDFFATSEW